MLAVIATVYEKCNWISFGLVAAFFFGRILFSLGYAKCGPQARIPGALIMDLVLLAQLVLSIVSVVFEIKKYTW